MSLGACPLGLKLALLVLAICGLIPPPLAAADADQPFAPRAGDQIWLVSTRGTCDVSEGWSISRLDAGFWKSSSDQAFHQSDDQETSTVIYIHGNRMDSAGAESRGLGIYRELVGNQSGGKVRFVIWSWPSDQIHGPFKDVRTKAARSDDEAYLLARFLAPIPKTRRVGLIGFSFGARIVSGSLHILGGGDVNGREVEAGERANYRVVFWAAGVQNDWLLPGNVHGKALPLGEKWLNFTNRCDSVLRRFHRVDPCDDSPGLGYTGLAGKDQLPADLAARYEDLDVAHLVGNDHRSEPYFFSSEIIGRTRETLLK